MINQLGLILAVIIAINGEVINSEVKTKIEGEAAFPGEFPFTAFLLYRPGEEEERYDGGSIIGQKHVLTSAYAVRVGYIIEEVAVGCISTNENCWRYGIQNVIVHPEAEIENSDIAIVTIAGSFTFNDFVQKVPLTSKIIQPGTNLQAVGLEMDSLTLHHTTIQSLSENEEILCNAYPAVNITLSFCTTPGVTVMGGVFGHAVLLNGDQVGIAYAGYNPNGTDVVDLIFRVEPYLGFIYSIIQ